MEVYPTDNKRQGFALDTLATERIVLERMTYAHRIVIDRCELSRMTTPQMYARISDHAEAVLIDAAFELWEDPEQRIEDVLAAHSERVPADWWQHLKFEFAPTWFLHRWPVKWTRLELYLDVELSTVYPNVKRVPGDGDRIVITRVLQEKGRRKWIG